MIELILSHPEMTGFAQFIGYSTMQAFRNRLLNSAPKTLFVPSNRAMVEANLDPFDVGGSVARLEAHLLLGNFPSDNFLNGNNVVSTALTNATYVTLPNNQGSLLKVTKNGIQLRLDWGHPTEFSNIIAGVGNIVCTDGWIHIVDKVLGIPPPMMDQLTNHGWNSFYDLVNYGGQQIQGLINSPGVTVLVADNEAFQALPDWRPPNVPIATLQNMARFHVIQSLTYFSNMTVGACYQTVLVGSPGRICVSPVGTGQVRFTDWMGRLLCTLLAGEADIVTKNGIIQVLDQVMIPNLALMEA